MAREQLEMLNLEERAAEKKPGTVSDPQKKNNGQKAGASKNPDIPLFNLFKYADLTDKWLMVLGTIGTIADGVATPATMVIMSSLIDAIGKGPSGINFTHMISTYTLRLVYLSIAVMVVAFLEAFCWARTGERQASRMRIKYLKAVLRQDEGFFDTEGTTTSEVVTSVSNDTLIIQDVFAEKLPSFIMNMSLFVGSYFVAFYLTWRLATVSFPFISLLMVPGILYGRILGETSKKLNAAYNVAGNIAEQALSSIRTVFSFVGEERTMAKFSNALNGTVELGLKQGLVKGLAIGSGGLSFGIWAFNSWYGSRLVMYHGASGAKIFVTRTRLFNFKQIQA